MAYSILSSVLPPSLRHKRAILERVGWNFGFLRKSPVAKAMTLELHLGHPELQIPPRLPGQPLFSFLPETNPEKGAASGLLCVAPYTSLPWHCYRAIISTWNKCCQFALWEPSVRQLFGAEVSYVCGLCESTVNVVSSWNGIFSSTACEHLLCRMFTAALWRNWGAGRLSDLPKLYNWEVEKQSWTQVSECHGIALSTGL